MQYIGALVISLLIGTPAAADTLGIVLMHGKQGQPTQFAQFAATLEEAGYLTERPEMCWSRERIYDLTYLDCFRDIDAAIARLRTRGATAIVIAGQSLGGNGALGYGARHKDLKGIVAMAPAHAPQFLIRRPEIASSVATAQTMISEGRADEKADFTDVNIGEGTSTYSFQVRTTATVYMSFFGPDSPAIMGANAARLTAPLLMINGDNDPSQRGASQLFASAPPQALNRHLTISVDHRGTPAASRDILISWLKELVGN